MRAASSLVDSPYIHAVQLRHFLAFDVTPLLFALALPIYFRYLPHGWFELMLCVAFWLITGVGITVGYHRYFTHRSFQCARPLQAVLAVCAAMAGQGGVTSWAAIHRYHHENSDKPGDLHSPNLHGSGWRNELRGLLHSHFVWMSRHSYPNVARYVPDILRDGMLSTINRYYYYWVAVGLVIPTGLGAIYHHSVEGALAGLLWGGIIRIFVVEHIIWAVNSLGHSIGTRPYDTRENSRNLAPLAILTLGECWHNNHHKFTTSASFGLHWYKLDPGYWFIKTMQLAGLAWDVKVPPANQISPKQKEEISYAAAD
jgi:stearoyl-CoA desaturase (delta-9 desaturase)